MKLVKISTKAHGGSHDRFFGGTTFGLYILESVHFALKYKTVLQKCFLKEKI